MLKRHTKRALGAGSHRLGVLRAYRRIGGPRVSVLMYHRVHSEGDPLGLTVKPDSFDRQLRLLKDRYPVVSLDQAVEELGAGTLNRHVFVITFDDGYRDNFLHAYPILSRHGIPATIFVTCEPLDHGHFGWSRFDEVILRSTAPEIDLSAHGLGIIGLAGPEARKAALVHLHRELKKLDDGGRRSVMAAVESTLGGDDGAGDRIMLSWDEVRIMVSGGLVSIGSHTLTHPILTRIPPEQASVEIKESKRRIERETGARIDHFAYPNGGWSDFDADIVRLTRESGYRSACATIPGTNRPGADLFSLRRLAVTPDVYEAPGGRFSEGLFVARISALWDGLLFRS